MKVKYMELLYIIIKRFFDIILCGFALIVLSPIYLITAIAIKLSSPGPVLYYSDRAGLNGKAFHFYKFRSMHQTNKDKGMFQADPDRLFPVGKLIRRWKIDELPQLLNVIKGDMSIVGPRPMTMHGVDEFYVGRYEEVRSVKPGLTSVASLFDYKVGDTYHDDAAYEREVLPMKNEMELYYVHHRSFIYDCELVWRTIVTIIQVVFGKKEFKPEKEYAVCKRNLEELGLFK